MPDREIEFKLVGETSHLDALVAARLLTEAGAPKTTTLASTYFDTHDRRLQAAGVVVRIRQTPDGRRVQTVKTRGDGLVSRGEWESAVNQSEPDLNSLQGTPVAKLITADDVLDPLFTVAVERSIWIVSHGRSRVEVAIDRGRIFKSEDPASSAPVTEVELELKAGDVEDLAELVAVVMEAAPLKLGVASKAARGHALLEGRLNDVARAAPVAFGDAPTAADAFRTIANACLVQIRLNEDVMVARRDPDALHQTRVAIRRLRSAFSLFGPLVAHPRTDALKAELKRLSAPLGLARDLDVFLSETLADERERHPDEDGVLTLEKQLQTRKSKAYDRAVAALRSDEWRALLVDLAAWINTGPWSRPRDGETDRSARAFAAAVLEKRFRQLRRKSRRIAKISDEKRHDARIAAKKLRYGSEFFAELFADPPKRAQRRVLFLKALKKLQGRLGDLNDVATGHELMADAAQSGRSRQAAFAAGVAAADVDARTGPLLNEAKAARKALMDAKVFWR